MWSTSGKPWLTTSAILSPFLSSKALVATVVPIRIQSICDVSIEPEANFWPVSDSKILRIPSVWNSKNTDIKIEFGPVAELC